MKTLFQYNWQVREDWFTWCKDASHEELIKERVGGVGGILQTLFHIIVVEYSWICDLTGQPIIDDEFEQHASLDQVILLSQKLHPAVHGFVTSWTGRNEHEIFTDFNPVTGTKEIFRHGEALRHVIAHEIHHMGQLSIWAREMGKEPVTANLIRRGLFV